MTTDRPIIDIEKTAAGALSLQRCPGWNEWFVPLQRARMEAIKEELLSENLHASLTERLRMEYRILESVVERPEKVLKQLRSLSAVPAGPENAAV